MMVLDGELLDTYYPGLTVPSFSSTAAMVSSAEVKVQA